MDRIRFQEGVQELFEHINDKNDLEFVLEELSNTCHGIAEHIATNWQDDLMADLWDRYGDRIDDIIL